MYILVLAVQHSDLTIIYMRSVVTICPHVQTLFVHVQTLYNIFVCIPNIVYALLFIPGMGIWDLQFEKIRMLSVHEPDFEK